MPRQLTGRERTAALTQAAVGYLVKRRFSCYVEVGVSAHSRGRCDILALNMRRELIAVEVKQSWADYAQDKKFLGYLPLANQLYLCLPHDFGDDRINRVRAETPPEVGVMVLETDGLIRVVKPSRRREICRSLVRETVTKLAWRGGIGRHKTKRYRVYL